MFVYSGFQFNSRKIVFVRAIRSKMLQGDIFRAKIMSTTEVEFTMSTIFMLGFDLAYLRLSRINILDFHMFVLLSTWLFSCTTSVYVLSSVLRQKNYFV